MKKNTKQIGNIVFNINVIEAMTFEEFKELYPKANWKATGLTVDQLAKQLGVVKEKVEK